MIGLVRNNMAWLVAAIGWIQAAATRILPNKKRAATRSEARCLTLKSMRGWRQSQINVRNIRSGYARNLSVSSDFGCLLQ